MLTGRSERDLCRSRLLCWRSSLCGCAGFRVSRYPSVQLLRNGRICAFRRVVGYANASVSKYLSIQVDGKNRVKGISHFDLLHTAHYILLSPVS